MFSAYLSSWHFTGCDSGNPAVTKDESSTSKAFHQQHLNTCNSLKHTKQTHTEGQSKLHLNYIVTYIISKIT